MLRFKKAELSDFKIIRQIACITWLDTFTSLLPADQIKYMLELIYNEESICKQVEEGHHFILVEWDGENIGYVSYEINYEAKQHLMIHKLYLLPKIQGLGIGTKILNFLTGIAIMGKNEKLRLKVFHKNIKALVFYERYGFYKTGDELMDFGNGFTVTDYIMEKPLKIA